MLQFYVSSLIVVVSLGLIKVRSTFDQLANLHSDTLRDLAPFLCMERSNRIPMEIFHLATRRGCYGDTCADIDTGACVLLQKRKPDLCNTTTFDAACKKFCGHCSPELTCYHCPTAVSDPKACTQTKACAAPSKCVIKSLYTNDSHQFHIMTCDDNKFCDSEFTFGMVVGRRRRDLSINCCSSNLCNVPNYHRTPAPSSTGLPTTIFPAHSSHPIHMATGTTANTGTTTIDPSLQVFCQSKDAITCPTTLNPLCASDNQFYLNQCEFTKARCDNGGLTIKDAAFCGSHPIHMATGTTANTGTTTIDPSLQVFCQSKDAITCPTTLDPLCASDKNLYLNQCEFTKARCVNGGLTRKVAAFCNPGIGR